MMSWFIKPRPIQTFCMIWEYQYNPYLFSTSTIWPEKLFPSFQQIDIAIIVPVKAMILKPTNQSGKKRFVTQLFLAQKEKDHRSELQRVRGYLAKFSLNMLFSCILARSQQSSRSLSNYLFWQFWMLLYISFGTIYTSASEEQYMTPLRPIELCMCSFLGIRKVWLTSDWTRSFICFS